ncbi:outer membrane beta-barrel protein [Riemerella columbina]|uniref:outer membrane beta-barrel protein n=1 Tax=Riemerella columbina TaxID=103810 RepID=UPI0026703A70|nr:outer membrane beta-barrel protein [Riemerella columbina]WKS95435.1 outer membrane beta-barrel family protein [Riemerella columbina]
MISSIPHISVGNNNVVHYKGNAIQTILINDIKASMEEFKSIPIEEIASVELLHAYINTSNGETELALNVKTKFKPGVKGYLDFSPGVLQEFFYGGTSVSVKSRNTIVRLMHSNLWNSNEGETVQRYLNQAVDYKMKRNLYQPFGMLSVNHHLSDNQSLNLKFLYSGINEQGEALDNNHPLKKEMNLNYYGVNFLYDWSFGKYVFKLNSDYILNNQDYENKSPLERYTSHQNFKEFAISPFLSRKLEKGTVDLGIIYTDRHFDVQNLMNGQSQPHSFNQSLFNIVLKANYDITKKLSATANIRYQAYQDAYTKNETFLPYIKILQGIGDKTEIGLAYHKKIYRPNIYTLSGGVYKETNGITTLTNPLLSFQTSHYYETSFSHQWNKVNISLSGSYEKIKNHLSILGRVEQGAVINQMVNADREEFGPLISLSIPLLKTLDLNTYYGYQYSNREYQNQVYSGDYYRLGVSLRGKLKNYNFYVNTDYRNKIYDVNYYRALKPDISFSISRNFFKNLIYASLAVRNILDNDATQEFTFEDQSSMKLKNTTYMNSRLILLTLSYNFGKNFNSQTKNINKINNDLLPN